MVSQPNQVASIPKVLLAVRFGMAPTESWYKHLDFLKVEFPMEYFMEEFVQHVVAKVQKLPRYRQPPLDIIISTRQFTGALDTDGIFNAIGGVCQLPMNEHMPGEHAMGARTENIHMYRLATYL